MEAIIKHYIIDLSSNNNFISIPTVQGDGNGVRTVEVELVQNGTTYVLDETVTGAIMGTKPDTKQIANTVEITEEGYIRFDITSQMAAVKGRGDYQIVLFDGNTNSQLKSFPFIIITTEAVFDVDYLVSTDEFQLLTSTMAKALADYSYIMENAQASADAAESSATQAREDMETTEGLRDETAQLKEDVEGLKDDVQVLKDDVVQLKDDTEQIKSETEDVRDEAIEAKNDANTYATSALESKNQASDFADLAKSYAIGTDGEVRQDDEQDNSKYYYEKSKEIAQGLVGTLRPKGSILFEEVSLLVEVEAGDMYNIKDNFVTTDDFREGAGIKMPAGTNIFRTVDEQWDCLAGTNVIGVKGEAEVTYRVGEINITRQNIGNYEVTSASEPTSQNIGEFWNLEY